MRGERRACEVVKWRKGGILWLCFQSLKVEKISEAFLGKKVSLLALLTKSNESTLSKRKLGSPWNLK